MSQATAAPDATPESPATFEAPLQRRRLGATADILLRSVLPIFLALCAGAVLLLALGRNPITFYQDIIEGGLEYGAWQDSAMLAATFTLIGVGLVVVFRAGIWNLGIDGQFLLAAAIVAGLAPALEKHLPNTINLIVCCIVGAAVGAAWTIVPATLKARYELNEIITTLMMTFIGINLANILIKGPFQDFSSNVPQTSILDFTALLPTIPSTRMHVGTIVALVAAILVWFLMGRTSFGLRLQVLGANVRAARHMGLDVPRLIVVAFLLSGAFIGLSAAGEILGIWGYVRADWDPGYGLWVVPLVFLARMNALAVVPLCFFLATVQIGGDFAAQQAELTPDFTLALVGFMLFFMAVTEWLGRRRDLGRSYIPSTRRKAGQT